MDRIGPGTAVRLTDYSQDPRELLRALASPLREWQTAQQLPVLHLRRGWRHGSHLLVTVRPYPDRPVDPTGFVAAARAALATRDATPPDEATYLRRAEQLARWENARGELLPRYPQGHVRVGPATEPVDFPPVLARARDQILDRYTEPVLATADLPAADLLPGLARVLALVARSHPGGIAVGALAFRSHVEGVSSATGRHTDLRARFAARFDADHEVFVDALTGPVDAAPLRAWQVALGYAWGLAEGLAAQDELNDKVMQAAVGRMEYPMGEPVRSEFIAEYLRNRAVAASTYRQIAYRVVLNTVYAALTCFGITPMQRYYLCYGLSEATDRLVGATSIDRMRARRAELAPPAAQG